MVVLEKEVEGGEVSLGVEAEGEGAARGREHMLTRGG